jgi:hypothetical protein
LDQVKLHRHVGVLLAALVQLHNIVVKVARFFLTKVFGCNFLAFCSLLALFDAFGVVMDLFRDLMVVVTRFNLVLLHRLPLPLVDRDPSDHLVLRLHQHPSCGLQSDQLVVSLRNRRLLHSGAGVPPCA